VDNEKFAGEGGSTWAEQTDAEEKAAAAVERQVCCMLLSIISLTLSPTRDGI